MWEFLAYVALTVLLVLVGVLVFAVYRLQRELEGQNYVPGRHRLNGQESPSANRRSGDLYLDRRREARRGLISARHRTRLKLAELAGCN